MNIWKELMNYVLVMCYQGMKIITDLMRCWRYVLVPYLSRCVVTFYLGYVDEIILCINEGCTRKEALVVSFEQFPSLIHLAWTSDSGYLQYSLFESNIFLKYEEYININKL